ncbi:MAG: chromosomal replication initiator protein DnaA [Nitratireductor sp.]|nr:chromosomal replication initiator protein DnaA [Nitratireductor sp.]
MTRTSGENIRTGTNGGARVAKLAPMEDGDMDATGPAAARSRDKAVADSEPVRAEGDHSGWLKVRQSLQAQLGTEIFNSWFGRIKLVGTEGGVAVHSVPTAFLKSWINSHYRDLLLELWQKEDKAILRADVIVRSAVRRLPARPAEPGETAAKPAPAPSQRKPAQPFLPRENGAARGARSEQEPGFAGSPLDPKYTFANFIEGKSNRIAYAAARSVAEGEGAAVRFNPLFIHASVGLGKTHLLQAIAWETRQRDPAKKVRYLTADYFMWVFAKALHNQTALSLKETLRDIDLLLIDDMQFLQGKAIQAEFCHLLNELIDSARQVVVAADRPPAELESLNERVRSRLKGGVSLDIETPDYELRKSILNMRYEEARRDQPGLDIPEDIRHYVARQVNTSCRDIDGAFNQLLLQHKYSDGPEGFEELDKMLRHLIKSGDQKRVRIEDIQRVVARQFNVARNDLLSNRRTQQIVRPRQIAMYLSKVMTPRSLPEIGRRFGGRDHTTVLHAVRKIEDLMSQDHKLAQEIELLKRLILD